MGANLLGRNLDGNPIAWKYRTCAGHADIFFVMVSNVRRGNLIAYYKVASRTELALGAARESGHNSLCQNRLKVLLRATVRDRPI